MAGALHLCPSCRFHSPPCRIRAIGSKDCQIARTTLGYTKSEVVRIASAPYFLLFHVARHLDLVSYSLQYQDPSLHCYRDWGKLCATGD